MTNTQPQLFVKEIADATLRKNFQGLQEYFQAQNQLLGFQFLELNFLQAAVAAQVSHNLGCIPQDILVTRITGPGEATFLWNAFTSRNMYVTVSGPCRIRFFYGNYWNFQSGVQNQATDLQATASKLAFQTVVLPLTQIQVGSGNFPGSTLTSYAMLVSDDIVLFDLTNGSLSLQVPPAAQMTGRRLSFAGINLASNSMVLKTTETIDGSTSKTLNAATPKLEMVSTGTLWRTIL